MLQNAHSPRDMEVAGKALRIPTSLVAILAQKAGFIVCSEGPRSVTAQNGEESVVILLRQVNPYRRKAEYYIQHGSPVPQVLLEDIEKWEQEHGYSLA